MFSPMQGAVQVKVEHTMGNLFQPSQNSDGKVSFSGFDTTSYSSLVGNTASDTSSMTGSEVGAKHYIKTMCLAKKTVRMPTKDEHGFLLFCGLGARKWQCSMDCDSLTFKQAILNIYPRLRSVIGYNLWTLTDDKKTFERIPEKVNTPMRMRAYLGSRFTGCMIIVPVSDIVLMEERREHLRQMDIKDVKDSKPSAQVAVAGLYGRHEPKVFQALEETVARRSLCLICGRIEKTPGTGVFHKIMEENMPGATDRNQLISKKLTDILGFNFEQSRRKLVASTEICRKCLRTVCDLVKKEEEVKAAKEDLVTAFFSTTSKYNKHQVQFGMAEDATCPEYQHPFNQKALPLPMAFLSKAKPAYLASPGSLVQFYKPSWTGGSTHSLGSISAPPSPPDRRQNSNSGSDIASSSFLSVSPPMPRHLESYRSTYNGSQCDESLVERVSPHPASYTSLAASGALGPLRSKAQIKSYEPESRVQERRDKEMVQVEQEEKREAEEMQSGEATYNCRGATDSVGGEYSADCGPRSQESSGSSEHSGSVESTAPTRPGSPEEEKLKSEEDEAHEAEVERRKPWKKRKRAIESDQESTQSGLTVHKVLKVEGGKGEEDSTSSSEVTAQGQLDPTTSDGNN